MAYDIAIGWIMDACDHARFSLFLVVFLLSLAVSVISASVSAQQRSHALLMSFELESMQNRSKNAKDRLKHVREHIVQGLGQPSPLWLLWVTDTAIIGVRVTIVLVFM
jgi:hypothetical protein